MDGMLTAIFFVLLFYTRVEAYLSLVETGKTTVKVSSTFHTYAASRAVDGNVSQQISHCSHTDFRPDIKEAWLRVDLMNAYSMKSVKFWYRNDGCELGKYGVNCTMTCSHCKNNVSCGIVDGKCNDEGCAYPGYQKPYCQSCIDGKYGNSCNVTCSKFCKNKKCDRKTGVCTDGCVAGYTGSLCDQKCNDGNYGQNCSEKCGKCLEGTCNHVNGTCTGGCKAGYRTELCDTACEQNRYGNDCINKCGMCLHDKCNHVNGTCVDGCENGYQGNLCKKPCDSGSYGQNCSKSCGQCSNDTCDHVNGTCTSECKVGYRTNLCNITCSTGSYGKECKQKCSKNCMDKEKCNPINGTCKKCADGFRGEKCDQNCSDGTYGLGCKFNCSVHCLDDNSCNKVNGTCSKCHPGWHNNFCSALQLVETGLAIATSSSVYGDYVASRTIDGNTNQQISNCLHTATTGRTEAWLRVDLRKVFSIQSVKFWYRNDRGTAYWNTKRLRGYSIRSSNDTALPLSGSSCYTDPGNVTLPTIIEKDCERTARYVWIYQNNTLDGACPMLEICEVQVFGCETGIDKEQCQKPCTHCKDRSYCNPVSRSCNSEGCALPGYQAPLCQECVVGHYSDNCDKNCSVFCKNHSCEHTTGICTLGCQRGYIGSYCNQTCETDKFGQNCSETCGNCFENKTCNHVNGTCAGGCAAGFMTELCNTSCKDGQYGRDCQLNCSGNCLNMEICDKQNGACESCAEGYQGVKCDDRCETGRYGLNCTRNCGACLNDTDCHHVTGNCSSGCKNGWKDAEKCDKGCIGGRYGNNCGKTCSQFCRNHRCEQNTGICAYGCLKGYTGGDCNQLCEFGKYGQNCSETCGKCFENTCNHINGTCADGCAAGFMTNLCKTRCKDGRYGRDCQFKCSGNCLNQEVCDKQNGTCESCAEGYQGGKCDERCETGSYGLKCTKNCAACLHDTDCHHVTGMCSSGCKKGWKDVEKCDKGCVDGRYGNDCAKNCSKLCKYQTCEQTKGVCLHGCLEGYTGWECSEPQDLSDPTNNYQPILYGVMCTSLVFNIVSVILMVRHGVCQRKRGNQSTTEESAVPPIIYDAVEDNNEYQELGQLSESSHYTELQKI
uniref:Multiple epidermal growth factor-like domains protein 10 isoform X2 n=1 Tax=Crassostrea virginica TaxID=6565 RepID=A0A8B8C9S0_CRAVI|nr:multiple epidermal growth factor-like domains protein 10 isoform X2 [Crassostrea virginica]